MPPRKRPECANPLFLTWLEDLRDQARDKGLKIADVYAKGCRSLAACPVAYERPRDLVQLQGIGPKTVGMLETRLKAHCEETGGVYPASPKRARSKSKQPGQGAAGGEEDEGDEDDASVPKPPPKKRKAPKTYIPQQGSGPHGILIGLLLAVKEPEATIQVFLTKGELIRAAQPYCSSSYDRSERGTFVTAWNGMKTLVNKGYVVVQGSPHRYCLTEDGYDVAVTLRNLHPEFEGAEKLAPLDKYVPAAPAPRSASTNAEAPASSASTNAVASGSASTSAAPAPPNSNKFEFWYIDSSGNRVLELVAARLRLCPEEFVTLRRIEFRVAQKTHPIVAQLRQMEYTETSVFAYIVEDSAPPQCSCFSDEPSHTTSTVVSVTTTTLTRTALVPAVPEATKARIKAPQRPRLSSQLPLLGEECAAPEFDPADAITFPHGSYEVVLILDTREVESRSSRDKIAESLAAKNVKVETRALRLGDMCWVARRKDSLGEEEDECVLDYVVERKRLDDLCSSITDGRYQEQCFRLSQSGIGNVFYVVENWQVAARMESNGKQIMTAKSQIQVVNGFFLKETHKLADTIDFLATMTKVITSSHRDLRVIPSKHLSRTSYSSLQQKLRKSHSSPFLTSFESYQALNDKSAARTVRETLGRMLLCIRGMSPERVSALLDCWETPRALYDAMVARHAQGEILVGRKTRKPETFFADNVAGEGRRKIGEALSRDLWRCLWGAEEA